MAVAAQRLFAPGPVWVPERVREALARPMVHHRTPEFARVMAELRERLPRLFQTPGWESLVFCCSGTGAMEGAVANFMPRGTAAITVSNGKWGERWTHILRAYGCLVHELKLPWGKTCPPERLQTFLAQHPDARAVFLTSADTSTGVVNPIGALCRLIRERSSALVIVDSICDIGGVDLRPVEWGADVVVGASQKCLMCPPGLGLATVSPRAWAAAEESDQPRFYFDWREERKKQQTLVTASTSSVAVITALLESLRMLEEEGLPAVFARHARVGHAMRAAVAALGLELFPECATDVVTVVHCPPAIDAEQFFQTLLTQHRHRIAHGQEQLKGKTLRFGHMGYVSDRDLLGLIDAVELTLLQLGFPIRERGVATASARAVLARPILPLAPSLHPVIGQAEAAGE